MSIRLSLASVFPLLDPTCTSPYYVLYDFNPGTLDSPLPKQFKQHASTPDDPGLVDLVKAPRTDGGISGRNLDDLQSSP